MNRRMERGEGGDEEEEGKKMPLLWSNESNWSKLQPYRLYMYVFVDNSIFDSCYATTHKTYTWFIFQEVLVLDEADRLLDLGFESR